MVREFTLLPGVSIAIEPERVAPDDRREVYLPPDHEKRNTSLDIRERLS